MFIAVLCFLPSDGAFNDHNLQRKPSKAFQKANRQLNNGSAAYAPYLFNNRHR